MNVTITRLKELIDLVAEERLAELEISEGQHSLLIVRRLHGLSLASVDTADHAAKDAVKAEHAAVDVRSTETQGKRTSTIPAPMAGVFYRAAGSGDKPLVDIGQPVEPGTPLCIIEAMKIMNEIPADSAGTITQVLCENGQAVEQGEPLFVVTHKEA